MCRAVEEQIEAPTNIDTGIASQIRKNYNVIPLFANEFRCSPGGSVTEMLCKQ